MWKIITLFILIFHILILSNLRFTAWPEMLSYPYLLANGLSLYKDMIIPYPPLLVWSLTAVFKFFSFDPLVLKYFTWFLILFCDILTILIFRKLSKNNFLLVFTLIPFVIIQSFLDGNMLWFDFATVLPLLAAFYFSLNWIKQKSPKYLFLLTLFFCIAILVKQVALIYLLAFSVFCLFEFKLFLRQIKFFMLAIFVSFLPFLIFLLVTESFVDFWVWSIYYPLVEWSNFPGYVILKTTRKEVMMFGLLLLPLIGLVKFYPKKGWNKELFLSLLLLLAAIIAIYPRFSYFHLQPTIYFVFIIIYQIAMLLKGYSRFIYLGAIFLISIYMMIKLPENLGNQIRFYEAGEKKQAQEIIKAVEGERNIYLLDLNSSNYIFAQIIPPSPWLDNFGWYMEIEGVQEKFIAGLEHDQPKIILRRIPNNGVWYELGVYQPKKVVDYIQQKYLLEKTIEGNIQVWKRKD